MSVTPPVSHVEMWRYFLMASSRFESQSSTATRMESLSATSGETVGANVGSLDGLGVTVGADVGLGDGSAVGVTHQWTPCEFWLAVDLPAAQFTQVVVDPVAVTYLPARHCSQFVVSFAEVVPDGQDP